MDRRRAHETATEERLSASNALLRAGAQLRGKLGHATAADRVVAAEVAGSLPWDVMTELLLQAAPTHEPAASLGRTAANAAALTGLGALGALRMPRGGPLNATLSAFAAFRTELHPDHTALGGIAFETEQHPASVTGGGPDWGDLGAAWAMVPRLFLRRDAAGTRLGVQLDGTSSSIRTADDLLETTLSGLRRLPTQPARARLAAQPQSLRPDAHGWSELVHSALTSIEAGTLEKVVVARAVRVVADQPLFGPELLRRWHRREDMFTFCFRPGDGGTFIGVSPELLCRWHGSEVEAESLAGTRRRGDSRAQDDALASQLLESPKERHEHEMVRAFLVEALSAAGIVRSEETTVRRLANVQHLSTPVRATLRSARPSALELVHPTPAVCGVPRDGARAFLRASEPFDRGWYAGAVGSFSKEEGTFCVAIRSMLLRDDVAWLFAGAGIVLGSHPDSEWAETEVKLKGAMDALDPLGVMQ